MRRRELILAAGGALAAPITASAQQAMPVIGFLSSQSADAYAPFVKAFNDGLSDTGYIDGKNIATEYRWAAGDDSKLPALAADLVGRGVAVIAATGGLPSALAAKAATATIPIVFNSGQDPVEAGLVASFTRPGGNITGISWFGTDLVGKRIALMRDLVPTATTIAVLVNPDDPESTPQPNAAQDAARTLNCTVGILNATTADQIAAAFAVAARQRVGALVVTSGAFFVARRAQLVALAAQYAIPTMHSSRFSPPAGGLIFYGNDLIDAYRRNGRYVGRILKGDRPGDLPIDRSSKFELLVNLKTARTLGLTVPQLLLAQADEAIE